LGFTDLVIYGFGIYGFGFTDLGLTNLDLRICPGIPPDKDGNEKFPKVLILFAFLAPLIEITVFLLLFSKDFVFMRFWLWLISPLPFTTFYFSHFTTPDYQQ